MLVVNLYGAPGAGKSTGAAYVFAKLKMAGINAELVTEFAKDKVWEESNVALSNQAYIFGEQLFRLTRLQNKVDVVVTDSPILLSVFYTKPKSRLDIPEFDAMISKVSEGFDTFDAFIFRAKGFNPTGRLQTEEESDEISDEINEFLTDHGITCRYYAGKQSGYDVLVHDVMNRLGVVDSSAEHEVKFVSYSGEYPNLCSGTLLLRIDGDVFSFGKGDYSFPRFWRSGGSCRCNRGYEEVIEGEWECDEDDLPYFMRPYAGAIFAEFRDNVENGCCGGCIEGCI